MAISCTVHQPSLIKDENQSFYHMSLRGFAATCIRYTKASSKNGSLPVVYFLIKGIEDAIYVLIVYTDWSQRQN